MAKKDFTGDIGNVARELAGLQDKPAPTQEPAPNKRETRSRRVQLLLKPSIHDALVRLANMEGDSVNNIAELAFLAYIRKHK